MLIAYMKQLAERELYMDDGEGFCHGAIIGAGNVATVRKSKRLALAGLLARFASGRLTKWRSTSTRMLCGHCRVETCSDFRIEGDTTALAPSLPPPNNAGFVFTFQRQE